MTNVRHMLDLPPWDQAPILDHAQHLRDDDSVQRLWNAPGARLLVVNEANEFRFEPFGQAPDGEHIGTAFLGLSNGEPWFARRGEVRDGITIRDPRLQLLHYRLASSAIAILGWWDRSRYCARCGAELVRRAHGFSARCTGCGADDFPRTDPAVIVAVLDRDDRLFLAHQRSWAANRASILAGFVEAGESTENAVHREIFEESHLVVECCRYLGSQPWPFPRSLMLGFVARTHSAGQVDQDELEWGRFYSRDDVAEAVSSGQLTLPETGSIAHSIITAWRQERLPNPEGT